MERNKPRIREIYEHQIIQNRRLMNYSMFSKRRRRVMERDRRLTYKEICIANKEERIALIDARIESYAEKIPATGRFAN